MSQLQIHIDNETLAVTHKAQLLSVGVCAKVIGTDQPLHQFYVEIDQASYSDTGDFRVDPDTEKWWADRGGFQPTTPEPVSWVTAMYRLVEFFDTLADEYPGTFEDDTFEVWANSPQFDCEQIKYHLRHAHCRRLWGFWQERDFRTIRKLSEALRLNIRREEPPHHALGDATQQLEYVERVYAALGQHVQRSYDALRKGAA